MKIQLTLEEKGKAGSLTFVYSRMVNAGYVGRNQEEVQRHIEELSKKGIPGPATTPTLYPNVCRGLVTDDEIEVYGHETCGEAEYVLLVENEDTIYVGLGSDHTDRRLEEIDIARSKQICPNVISKRVWRLSEIEDHWDDIVLKSKALKDGREVPYQEGSLELIMDPGALMKFVQSKVRGSLDSTVIFSGTMGTLTGAFVYGERFSAELADPKLNRRLTLSYSVQSLDYLAVE